MIILKINTMLRCKKEVEDRIANLEREREIYIKNMKLSYNLRLVAGTKNDEFEIERNYECGFIDLKKMTSLKADLWRIANLNLYPFNETN